MTILEWRWVTASLQRSLNGIRPVARSRVTLMLMGLMLVGLWPAMASLNTAGAYELVELSDPDSVLDEPIYLTSAPGDYNRVFAVNRAGEILIFDFDAGEFLSDPFLDLTDIVGSGAIEQGLLGLAFHPGYMENGYFFVYYTDLSGDGTLSRFSVDADDPDLGDPESEAVMLVVDDENDYHNSGHLEFSPADGFLYLTIGDDFDSTNGQELETFKGKMLRLDVDDFDSEDYSIPEDNPFLDVDAYDEIWAYGLRNPWRFSIDPENGDIYVADVGEVTQEEISLIPGDASGGQNYGWDCMEGVECDDFGSCDCDDTDLIGPLFSYDYGTLCCILGGIVYRGDLLTDLQGKFLYSDWCTDGGVFALEYDGTDLVEDPVDITDDINPDDETSEVISMGRDAFGELYLVNMESSAIHRVVPDTMSDLDCDDDLRGDLQEIEAGLEDDCNSNDTPDACEIADGSADDEDGNGVIDSCEGEPRFIRGDVNDSGDLSVADPIAILSYLFESGEGDCQDAMDVNDDGEVDISDPIYVLATLYLSTGSDPAEPYPDCGTDDTDDTLECITGAACS